MSKKANKPQKLRARLPRGFVDRSPEDIRATDAMVAKIRAVYELYGFDPVETPMFEYTDALGKFLPDADRPNEGVFSLTDDDDQWMSLRYDLTAPLARHVAENINEIQLPYRTYRNGWVFRNEKPGPGRFRQFMQFDADTVGAPGVQADAEMCMMMADVMEALGIKRGDYVIRVNNRKVLDGVMEAIGLGGDENAERRLNVMRAIDKLDKVGAEGVRLLLGEGLYQNHPEKSGDFTKGVGLSGQAVSEVLLLFSPSSLGIEDRHIRNITETKDEDGEEIGRRPLDDMWYPLYDDLITTGMQAEWYHDNLLAVDVWKSFLRNTIGDESAANELTQIVKLCESAGYGSNRIRISPIVRGLEYYTGPVYEAELTFPVTNEKGQEVVFGSVGGGGRYDGLVKRFTGQDVPATGFSIGVSRLMTALKNLGKLEGSNVTAPVLVTVMDGDTEAMGKYQHYVQQLRQAGIRAEMYQGNWKKFGNQLKYADRRDCPIVIIQGSDERTKGKLQIKDMIEGRKQAAAIESNEEWRETRPGQFEIAEEKLVEEVQRLLYAQKVEQDG